MLKPGFRILTDIHLIRIRIRIRIQPRIQGFDDQKLGKIYTWKIFFFLDQKLQLTYP